VSIQFLRGNTAANDGYTGPVGSLTIDTELGNIRIHDGTNPGGWVIANVDESGSVQSVSGESPIIISGTVEDPVIEIQAASPTDDGYMSSTDKEKLDGIESGAEQNVGDVFDENGSYSGLRAQATTQDDVGLSNVDNTSDINKPVSTAQQSALDEKAPIENPTFIGTVTIDQENL
jgi:hypothetical protein